jgi:hypothetical protein
VTVDGLPPPPEQRVGDVVLRDGAGVPCAYGGTVSGRYWVRVPDLGAFELSPDSGEVRASVSSEASRELLLDGYYGTALPLFAQAVLGYEVMHASAVLVDGGAVAFCGQTGVGKSTIAAALSRRGFAHWADDAVALVSKPGSPPMSVFMPFTAEGRTISSANGRDEVLLGAVCLLERRRGSGAEMSRPSPSAAVMGMLSQAYRFSPQPPERRRKMVQTYLDVAAQLPVLLVRFSPSPDQLPPLLDRIESRLREVIPERG